MPKEDAEQLPSRSKVRRVDRLYDIVENTRLSLTERQRLLGEKTNIAYNETRRLWRIQLQDLRKHPVRGFTTAKPLCIFLEWPIPNVLIPLQSRT